MARFETHTVGSQVLVLPKGLKFEYPASPRSTTSMPWSPPSSRSSGSAPSEICCDDETFLRRVYLDVVGVPADRRGIRQVHDLDRPRQAGEADRRAARAQGVLRALGQQVGRDPPGQVVEHGQLQGDVPLLQLAGREALEEHADGPDGPGTARGQRRDVQEPLDQLLPVDERHPGDDRERRPGLHGHANPVRPVPQPPVRPLDAGRLLRLRGLLLADRPQAGRRSARDHHLQHRRRRGEPPGRQPPDGPQVPRREPPRRQRQGPPGRPGQVARLAREPLVRHLVRQPGLGPLLRLGDRRAGRRLPRLQPRHQPRAARSWASGSPTRSTTSRPSSATSATRGRISGRPSGTPRTSPTSGTSPTPTSGGSRPRTCSTRSRSSPRPRTSSRAARSEPGPRRSPTAAPRPTS